MFHRNTEIMLLFYKNICNIFKLVVMKTVSYIVKLKTVHVFQMFLSAGRRIWLQFLHFDLGSQHHNSGELQLGEQAFSEAVLEVDLSGENRSFQPYQVPGHLTDGAYVSEGERLHVRLRTADKPKGIGFKAVYRTGKFTSV
jgi:hypothetical protein